MDGSGREEPLTASQLVLSAPGFEGFESIFQLLIQILTADPKNLALAQVDEAICT